MELPPEPGAQRPATETSKHEKMARWQRVCILREAARAFQLPHGNREHPAVNHAANQRDYILTELPPPVAAAIADEVRPVLRRTRDLYRKRVGNKTELFAAVDAQLAALEPAKEPLTLSNRWGRARAKVGVVVALSGAAPAAEAAEAGAEDAMRGP